MGNPPAHRLNAGYRVVSCLLLVGIVGIGFTRLEDRAIIGPANAAANAMVAMASTTGEATDEGSYDGPPEDVVALNGARRTPVSRVRQILRDRSIPAVAARQILGPPPGIGASEGGEVAATDAALPGDAVPDPSLVTPSFASLAPPPPGTGTPVFAADLTPTDGGGAGTGGGGGTPPVTPVPEPAAWLCLILGLFAVGGAMRRRGSSGLPAVAA